MSECLRCGVQVDTRSMPRRSTPRGVCCRPCRWTIHRAVALTDLRKRYGLVSQLEMLDWLLRQHWQQIGLVRAA